MNFLANSWYIAGWAEQLQGQQMLAVRLLNQAIVLFRDAGGRAQALEDRCPHRGVPLSMGSVQGDAIQCIYHGLRFNGQGVCTHNPHIPGSPERLRNRSYPVIERYGALWVWTGAPEQADEQLIPNYDIFTPQGSDYHVVYGYMHVKAHVQLIVDNLLDLSHAEYLHANTVGTPGSSQTVQSRVSATDRSVTVHRKVFNLPPSAVFKPVWHATERIDQMSDMTWHAGSSLFLNLGIMPPGGELEQGFHFPSAHLLAPESDRSTHYFYAIARNFAQDSEELDQKIKATFQLAFCEEDRPVIEALQTMLDSSNDNFKPVDFTPGDGAATRVRRILQQLSQTPGPL